MPKPEEAQELKSFVQKGLGCGCPDEVFREIRIEENPHAFYGLPVDYLVTVGDRLLIGVCLSERLHNGIGPEIEKSLAAGKQLRDNTGFNRFRLVVVSEEPGRIADTVQEQFADLKGLDDRVHLHVVRPSSIPQFLVRSEVCAGTVCETLK
ncbi:MAG: hypothetical protein K9N10_03870 [Deltaproteobacteria bacterium]|nr:hypothetical protein [Deltaproteobacteria bacterium]